MQIGDTYQVRKIVTEEMTAERFGSGGLPVLATPYLITMVENAAYTLIQRALPAEKGSVGTMVQLTHTAPSPVGMEVTVTVEVTAISPNGKMIDFKASACDHSGPIGEGTHQRAVIDCERFMAKCQAKLDT